MEVEPVFLAEVTFDGQAFGGAQDAVVEEHLGEVTAEGPGIIVGTSDRNALIVHEVGDARAARGGAGHDAIDEEAGGGLRRVHGRAEQMPLVGGDCVGDEDIAARADAQSQFGAASDFQDAAAGVVRVGATVAAEDSGDGAAGPARHGQKGEIGQVGHAAKARGGQEQLLLERAVEPESRQGVDCVVEEDGTAGRVRLGGVIVEAAGIVPGLDWLSVNEPAAVGAEPKDQTVQLIGVGRR